MISALCSGSQDYAGRLYVRKIVPGLVQCLCDTNSFESQRIASAALLVRVGSRETGNATVLFVSCWFASTLSVVFCLNSRMFAALDFCHAANSLPLFSFSDPDPESERSFKPN